MFQSSVYRKSAIFMVGGFLIFVLYLYFFVRALSFNRLKMTSLEEKVPQSLQVFHEGFQSFRNQPRTLLKPISYLILAWFSNLAVYFFVFYALGFRSISFDILIIVYSLSTTIQAIAAGLSIELLEIVMTNLYVAYGIQLAISVTAMTLIGIVTFGFKY